MRKETWFRGASLKQRVNVFTTAALTAAVLVGAVFVFAPQQAEAGGGSCADEYEALVDAIIEVRLVCGREVWTDDCREATLRLFAASDDYIECTAEPI